MADSSLISNIPDSRRCLSIVSPLYLQDLGHLLESTIDLVMQSIYFLATKNTFVSNNLSASSDEMLIKLLQMFPSDHKCFRHQIKHTRTLIWKLSKNVFESRCFYCGEKTGNSGNPEVIWEFDDRLKIEQVRDMNRVVRLRNSVIHVLPAPLSPCQKRFHALRADVIHAQSHTPVRILKVHKKVSLCNQKNR